MLTPELTGPVQRSLAMLRPRSEQAAALFYDKLFERDPGAAAMFRGNMDEQGRRLMQMITVAVMLLDEPCRLAPMLRELGGRHAGYGVRPAHYATVGGAWLDTLSMMLGPAFTPPLRRAWAEVYAWIAATMQAGAMTGAVPGAVPGTVAAAGTRPAPQALVREPQRDRTVTPP